MAAGNSGANENRNLKHGGSSGNRKVVSLLNTQLGPFGGAHLAWTNGRPPFCDQTAPSRCEMVQIASWLRHPPRTGGFAYRPMVICTTRASLNVVMASSTAASGRDLIKTFCEHG